MTALGQIIPDDGLSSVQVCAQVKQEKESASLTRVAEVEAEEEVMLISDSSESPGLPPQVSVDEPEEETVTVSTPLPPRAKRQSLAYLAYMQYAAWDSDDDAPSKRCRHGAGPGGADDYESESDASFEASEETDGAWDERKKKKKTLAKGKKRRGERQDTEPAIPDEAYGLYPAATVAPESITQQFACPHCPLTFRYKVRYDNHVRTHNPHQCTVDGCLQWFADRAQCREHIRKAHGITQETSRHMKEGTAEHRKLVKKGGKQQEKATPKKGRVGRSRKAQPVAATSTAATEDAVVPVEDTEVDAPASAPSPVHALPMPCTTLSASASASAFSPAAGDSPAAALPAKRNAKSKTPMWNRAKKHKSFARATTLEDLFASSSEEEEDISEFEDSSPSPRRKGKGKGKGRGRGKGRTSEGPKFPHIEGIPLPDGRVQCPVPGCGKTFSGPHALDQHNLIHLGLKPFVCPYCGHGFAAKCNLKTHVRKHTLERPYKCLVPGCGKSFASRSSATSHMKSVHGMTDYQEIHRHVLVRKLKDPPPVPAVPAVPVAVPATPAVPSAMPAVPVAQVPPSETPQETAPVGETKRESPVEECGASDEEEDMAPDFPMAEECVMPDLPEVKQEPGPIPVPVPVECSKPFGTVVERTVWKCPRCTLENSLDVPICEVCGALPPVDD